LARPASAASPQSPAAKAAAGQSSVSSSLFFPGRKLSCGIVVLAPTRELLLCHVTGQRHWDLPKGGIHDGETPAEAALRETMEETGLVFAPESLVDLGRFAYTARRTCISSPRRPSASTRRRSAAKAPSSSAARAAAARDGRLRLVRDRSPARALHAAHDRGAEPGARRRPGGRGAEAGGPRASPPEAVARA
jgi:ADP-ribose pyrophosphatase YjhB (NUDIX family)